MPQQEQKPKPSTAAQRADEALERAAPAGKSPARRTLAFLLEGSHDAPVGDAPPPPSPPVPDHTRTAPEPVPVPDPSQTSTILAIAPERDYNKRANSLEREALPAGAFPGSSKKIYDALYFRTRGAVKPIRTIQATRRDLMQWTGIKNIKTIHDHTRRLAAAGLIRVSKIQGDHEGSIYEVILPEEVDPYQTRTSTEPVPLPNQKSVLDPDQKTVRVGMGNPTENKGSYEPPKTSFKTNTENDDDDAALAGVFAALKSANKEITGKELSRADADRWREVADVLVAELKIAAARTTVSNVPAFLAEHLRRRLWKVDKKQARAEGRELPDERVSSAPPQEDSKDCPDCGGSGWWYPEGPERGVTKCKHARLKQASEEDK